MPLIWTGPRQFSISPRSPECYQDPYSIYSALHQVPGPVYWNDYKLWCLTGFDQVNRTLKSAAFARLPSHRQQTTYPEHLRYFEAVEQHSLLALEPPEHTKLRGSLNRSFIAREINRLAPLIEKQANNCIDAMLLNGSAELLQDYATPIPVRVIASMLGVPFEESQQLLDWSHAMVKVYTLSQTKQDELAADKAAQEFAQRIRSLIKAKSNHPEQDLISSWIHSNKLSHDEIISLAILLLNAGHEATVHQLGNSIKLLLDQPEHRALLHLSDKHADAVVNEALRFDPPLHLFTRYAQADNDLGHNIVLKQDEQVALLLAAANRDATKFQRADQFDPARNDGASLALGAGTHFCVGAYLAKLELRIALQVLFRRIPSLYLTRQSQYKDSFHFHGLDKLEVSW